MMICARVLSLSVIAALLWLAPMAVSATSVSLVWKNAVGGPIASISADRSTVSLLSNAVATLTLDVVLDIDSRGVAGVFLTISFDTDLKDELDLVSWTEFSWVRVNTKGITTHLLAPLAPGIESTLESTGGSGGQVFKFDGASLKTGPVNTTLTFARLVFTSSGVKAGPPDGRDIFSHFGATIGCNALICDITSDVVFNNATVDGVPEPGTVTLLGLGVGALALARRRRNRK